MERGVGHHLIEDDREQVLALEALEDAPLIRHRRRGIAVVDEEHLDRRIVVFGERAPEVIHVDQPGARFVRADPGAVDAPRRGIAHRVAAAADAELAADGRQRQHRHRRVAAVAVPFESPAASDERGRAVGVQPGDPLESGRVESRDFRRPLDGPRLRALAQLVGSARVLAQEGLVRASVRKEIPMDRQRDDHVGSRFDRQVLVGEAGERCRPRIDDDEPGAAFLASWMYGTR